MQPRGKALVFESIEEYRARIDDPNREVDKDPILVLKNGGPKGYPGMAEVGNMGLPSKILKQGITDMVRISDARMSGTAYGTVLLHVSPEAAAGSTLSVVETGDFITVDVEGRRLEPEVSDAAIAERLTRWEPPQDMPVSGYARLYIDSVTGADFKGCCIDTPRAFTRTNGIHALDMSRLWRSLKYDCACLHTCETGSQAKAAIGSWITFYNHRRPHTAHGSQLPAVVYFNSIETHRQAQAVA